MSGRYSLEALRKLCAAREEALELELSERAKQLTAQAAKVQAESDALAELVRGRKAARASEAEVLATEGLRVSELVAGVLHESGAVSNETAQKARILAARQSERAALEDRARTAEALSTAHAEREAVERHHERFLAEQRQKLEDASDEAALETWNNQHLRPGRS